MVTIPIWVTPGLLALASLPKQKIAPDNKDSNKSQCYLAKKIKPFYFENIENNMLNLLTKRQLNLSDEKKDKFHTVNNILKKINAQLFSVEEKISYRNVWMLIIK